MKTDNYHQPEHSTLNIQRATSSEGRITAHWLFDVRCWLLDVSRLLLVAGALSLARVLYAAEPETAGWFPLFDGKDLSGWTVVNGGEFSVTNGIIHLGKGTGWLRSPRPYTNFTFEAEWRALEPRYNSGFLIRAGLDGAPFPTNVWQVNLKETALGGLMRGSNTIVTNTIPARPVGEWSRFRIHVQGSTIAFEADGARIWEFKNLDAPAGYIGLQAENKGFEFRNVKIVENGD